MATVTEVAVVGRADGTFQVDVHSHGSATTHVVSIPAGYPAALGCDNVPPEQLIRASFLFLLEREPGTSILRRFRLDQIADYFPDYPVTIGQRLQDRD